MLQFRNSRIIHFHKSVKLTLFKTAKNKKIQAFFKLFFIINITFMEEASHLSKDHISQVCLVTIVYEPK